MINAYCDGAVRVSNPGVASCAWVMYNGKGEHLHSESYYLGPELRSNNYAEYMGLIHLLEWLYAHQTRNVVIHSDSKLVVNQVIHNWECNGDLKPLMSKAYGLLVQGCHILKHIKGHDGNKGNERADGLCNAMLDAHKEEYELYLFGKN
jgi:probable phosphoglycerate mutase